MNTVTEGKMWFLHCQLLTKIMAKILEETNGDTHLEGIIQKKINVQFGKIIGNISGSQDDLEYAFFRVHIKPKNGDDRNLKNEINSIIDGLSGPAYRAASHLVGNGNNENGVNTQCSMKKLRFILTIGYLNRKLCLGAEGVVKKKGNWYIKNNAKKVGEILNDNDKNAMQLFLNCLRPRLNYIGAGPHDKNPFKKNEDGEYKIETEYTVKMLVELFDGLSMDAELDVPFSKLIHRRRGFPGNNPLDSHLLGIDAGAHINAITPESTLGKIRQRLPLRCDISGTTVDAMGFCDTFIKKGQEGSNNKEERMTYLVSCMLSMCLTGHHSLDEMALALSLDVKEKKYDPCNPASVIKLLEEWSGWDGFSFPETDYFNSKAEGILRIDNRILKKLEFTKELWDGLAIHNKIKIMKAKTDS